MCYLCMKDDVFGGKGPTDEQLLRERAAKLKELVRETEVRERDGCHVGDLILELLKQEQYNIARQL